MPQQRRNQKRVQADAKLLETLTFITEYPAAILGGFDASYLTLPKEVLTMVMRFHQKYFAVSAADGSLAPNFIAVMNIPSDAGTIDATEPSAAAGTQ